MLLMIEALLLISSTLMDHRASAASEWIFPFDMDLDYEDYGEEILPLDMALASVDDLYAGCKTSMSCLVKTSLLEKELSKSDDFKTVWDDAQINHKPPEDELKKDHSVAIYVYTNSRYNQYEVFNNAVRRGQQEYRDMTYKWYSLQFLLTEAIQILKDSQKGCKSTYRGTEKEFDTSVLSNNIRFGSFTSSSLNREVAEKFGKKSCFEITTCEGADLRRYSKFPDESEVLIPPYEVFKVKEIKTRSDQKDLWCETVFVLESIGVRSDLNCDLFRTPEPNRQRVRMHHFRHIPYPR